MGLFDGRSASYSGHERSQSYHGSQRGHSPARSVKSTHSTSRGAYVRPSTNRSSSSFFGNLGGGGSSRGFGGSSSYYKRSPRQGYVNYLFHKLKRMLRELWYYAQRHPMKAFFAVVVPLLSAGGAIQGLMKQFGLPGGSSRGMSGGYYDSRGYGSDRGRGGGGGGLMDNAGSLMSIAKAFI